MAVQEHQKGESYDQAIQSYIPPGQLCPCHGDLDMFTPSVSPAHWKCARNKAENDQMLRSVASVGSQNAETTGFEKVESVYSKIMADPRTKEYAKHLHVVLHNVKNSAYWLHIYCNGCRSYSRLMYVRAADAAERSEALEIANNVFKPYLDYFGDDNKRIDGRSTFSFQAPPQPSLLHVWSKDNPPDCAWICLDNAIRRQDHVLTRPHLQLYMADSLAATEMSTALPGIATADQNRPLDTLNLQAPPPPKTPLPPATTYPPPPPKTRLPPAAVSPPPPGAATSSQGQSQTAQGPPGAATSSEPPASSSASESATIMPTSRWRKRSGSPETRTLLDDNEFDLMD